jgi:8-oxo-dGTP pyrophosphatase MutT (NUDIX family)
MTKTFKRTKRRPQFGAAPFRFREDGKIEVLLVTTRETKRWMVPKGWPIKKLGPLGTAMREAYEEAGVRGDCGPSIGSFDYLKVMHKGPDQICVVELFPLRVTEELDDWPEKAERDRRWFSAQDASAAVEEEPLKIILADLPERLGRTD